MGKLKSELKNQKKVVDKNVPLNRLGLKSQGWLIEPDLEGLTDNFKPLHLSKNKGWRVGAGEIRASPCGFIDPSPSIYFIGATRDAPRFISIRNNYKALFF